MQRLPLLLRVTHFTLLVFLVRDSYHTADHVVCTATQWAWQTSPEHFQAAQSGIYTYLIKWCEVINIYGSMQKNNN